MTQNPSFTRRTLLATAAAAGAGGSAAATDDRPAIVLPLHRLTAEAFAPFGSVLTEEGRTRLPINTYGELVDLYTEPFDSDQPVEWFIGNFRPRRNRVLFLERHMHITQTFIPLGGKQFVTIVARANAEEEANGLIKVEEMKAFVVPGDAAIQVHRGTWHENPFAVHAEGQRLLVTSHRALTRGHARIADERLAALPLDLERRFYLEKGVHIGFEQG
jgi:ureidoglycolate lyase